MALLSKRESRRTRNPEISIRYGHGERTRPRVLFAAPRRELFSQCTAAQRVTFIPLIGEGANLSTRGACAPQKLLAQSCVPSEDRCAMNRCAPAQTCARVLITAALFAAFSWTLLVSISPRLHASIHDDANRSEHVCAITLIASGSYEHSSQPPIIRAPQLDVCFAESSSVTPVWVKPLFLNAHIFAHAPPVHS